MKALDPAVPIDAAAEVGINAVKYIRCYRHLSVGALNRNAEPDCECGACAGEAPTGNATDLLKRAQSIGPCFSVEGDGPPQCTDDMWCELHARVADAIRDAVAEAPQTVCEWQGYEEERCQNPAVLCRQHIDRCIEANRGKLARATDPERAALVDAGDQIYGALRIAAGPYEGPADPLEPLFETWDALAHPTPEPAGGGE